MDLKTNVARNKINFAEKCCKHLSLMWF